MQVAKEEDCSESLVKYEAPIGADLHSLSHRLHSCTLEGLGLVAGISSFCDEFSEQQGVHVDFAHKDLPPSIPPDVALCLFRIV